MHLQYFIVCDPLRYSTSLFNKIKILPYTKEIILAGLLSFPKVYTQPFTSCDLYFINYSPGWWLLVADMNQNYTTNAFKLGTTRLGKIFSWDFGFRILNI